MFSAVDLIHILSDLIMVFYVTELIGAFGVSKFASPRRRLISAGITLLMTAIIVISAEPFSSVIYLVMFMVSFRIVFGEIKFSHVYIAVISEFVMSLLSSCLYAIIDGFIINVYPDFKIEALLFVRIIMLITAVILNRSEKVHRLHFVIKIIPGHIFVLTALSVMFISFLSENNSNFSENPLKQAINTLLISALTVSLIIMIFSLLINVVVKKQFWEVNELLRGQVEAQLRHYDRLEKLNDDIRSFRHDYINHMRSLISLLETGQYEDAKEYVEKLVKTSPAQDCSYQTGNHLADAILTDKNDLCGEYAKIVFYGFIPDRLDNADLCVILSNALDNAAEACRDLGGKSSIEVCAQERQGYFALTVRNPTSDVRTYCGIPETTKSDKLNHGFGLRNIEAAVRKYDGQLCVKCENMVFELSLTFKI